MMDPSTVLVVAAGTAWPFYRLTSAYVCQEGRAFRPVERIAFYSSRTIHGVAARIVSDNDHQVLTDASAAKFSLPLDPQQRRRGNVIAAVLAGPWKEGERAKIFLLSGPDEPETVRFPAVIHRGKSAWTMGQRYTQLDRLVTAQSTDDLASEVTDMDV